ncbi:hypothetical protein H2198_005726 [Neophaeococcomyces mojaviensis]|uniref:Uncharacterized protein n=1 Tax=Neophaeococcomyces mojaviensis TaxID=3383035 RepID=A0ACC3A570_9EURO|nr:hypothetical protein H2198_005726 [Knufia sp. JES_112]
MSDELGDKPNGHPLGKTRRIPDTEWEVHRSTIEKLYSEEGFSKKVVIGMLKEQGFTITKRDGDGKATRFTYYGFDVSEEKIQRAAKKLKVSASSAVVFSPTPPDQYPALNLNSECPRTEILDKELLTLTLSEEIRLQDSTLQDGSFFPVEQSFEFNTLNLDSSLLHFQTSEQSLQTTGAPKTTSTQITMAFAFAVSLDDNFVDYSLSENNLEGHHKLTPGMANDYIESSGSTVADLTELCTVLPTPVSSSPIPSCLSSPTVVSKPASGCEIRPSISEDSRKALIHAQKVLFHGTNSEDAIYPVQTISNLIQHLEDSNFLRSHAHFYGSSSQKLVDEIQDETLLSEIENIKLWTYQASAEFLMKKLTARGHSVVNSILPPQLYECGGQTSKSSAGSIWGNETFTTLASPLNSYCYVETGDTTDDTLRIGTQKIPKTGPDDEHWAPYYIVISGIPEVRTQRRVGICIALPRNAQAYPLYPTIHTFNVVPEDSEIIRCIEKNNLVGFRRLIENREASPRDVDSAGFSLLSHKRLPSCRPSD